jgi:hypothetical protein
MKIEHMDDDTFKDLAHAVIDWYENLSELTEEDAVALAETLIAIIQYGDEDDGEDEDDVEPVVVMKKKLDVPKFGYTAQEALNHCGSIDGSTNMRGR